MTTATADPPVTAETAVTAAAHANFFRPALAKIQGNLELLMGKTISITAAEPVAMDAAEATAALPLPCVVLGMHTSGACDAPVYCVVAQPLAITMVAMMLMMPDEAITARLSEKADLDDNDRSTLSEIGAFIVAAFAELGRGAVGQRITFSAVPPRFITDPTDDVLAAGALLYCETEVTVPPFPATRLALLAPPSLPDALSPKRRATPPGPRAIDPGSSGSAAGGANPARAANTLVVGAESFCTQLRSVLPPTGAAAWAPGFADLITTLEAGTEPALVIAEVPAGREFLIEMLGGLRRHPGMKKARLFVVLERPTRANVIRCGTHGLVEVLPQGIDPSVLSRKLAVALEDRG